MNCLKQRVIRWLSAFAGAVVVASFAMVMASTAAEAHAGHAALVKSASVESARTVRAEAEYVTACRVERSTATDPTAAAVLASLAVPTISPQQCVHAVGGSCCCGPACHGATLAAPWRGPAPDFRLIRQIAKDSRSAWPEVSFGLMRPPRH